MRIILASQSKIRKRGLDLLGLQYETIPSGIDEKAIRDPDPLKMAQKLSEAKAKAVGSQHEGLIIASDAFLVLQGKILEKPETLDEAHQMLNTLSGSTYKFITGLAVYHSQSNQMHSTVAACEIRFRNLSREEIKEYISRHPVLTYAGAHDGDGVARFSEAIQGNYNFFAALPMDKLIDFLRKFNINV